MKVPLLNLPAQYASIKEEVDAAVSEVFASQYFILGPRVEEFESAAAEFLGAEHAIGCSSGSDALLLAMMAEGVGPGDEVITSAFSFFATAGAIARTGAKPVFIDIDPETYLLDAEAVEGATTKRTKMIVPVHLYGRMVAPEQMEQWSQRVLVLEDAAQAFGSRWEGRAAGTIGNYGGFSFFPSKNLGGAGDGGLLVVSEDGRAELAHRLRNHGMEPKYHHSVVGGNFRLDALQAAVLHVKLRHLPEWNAARRQRAQAYRERLADTSACTQGWLQLPGDHPSHIYHQFVVRVPTARDALRDFLTSREVASEIYYPIALPHQECFLALGHRQGQFPHSERAARETLALPIYPELSEDQIDYVGSCIEDFYKGVD